MSEVIYNRIAVLRAERGISRRQLAEALNVHCQTVGYLERGEYSPSLYLALRLAAYFEVPVEVIFSTEPFPRIGSAGMSASLGQRPEGWAGCGMRPSRCAMAAASVRLAAPSLPRMLDTCTLAVFGAMNSTEAISLLLRPAAMSRRTSRSRLVSEASTSPSPCASAAPILARRARSS